MLAQTTDSGGNNGPMPSEMQNMFASADDPVDWHAPSHHIRCYAHKLNLTVGHGLKALGQKVSTQKSTIPHGFSLPVLVREVNGGNDQIEMDKSDSVEEDMYGLPDKPDGVEDDEGNEESNSSTCIGEKEDLVARALKKVNNISLELLNRGLFADHSFSRSTFEPFRLIPSVGRLPVALPGETISSHVRLV